MLYYKSGFITKAILRSSYILRYILLYYIVRLVHIFGVNVSIYAFKVVLFIRVFRESALNTKVRVQDDQFNKMPDFLAQHRRTPLKQNKTTCEESSHFFSLFYKASGGRFDNKFTNRWSV